MGAAPSEYLTIYEFEGEDAQEAERILGVYQSDPNSWDGREPNNDSMEVVHIVANRINTSLIKLQLLKP